MHRPGADPMAMEMADFLCDFCHQPWTDDRPMIEGHRGACICGPCLSIAYAELVLHKVDDPPQGDETCVLCLEPKPDHTHWRSPMTEKLACVQCVKRSAGALHKDEDINWRKPTQ